MLDACATPRIALLVEGRLELAERALERRDAHVEDGEAHGRVGRVGHPGSRHDRRLGSDAHRHVLLSLLEKYLSVQVTEERAAVFPASERARAGQERSAPAPRATRGTSARREGCRRRRGVPLPVATACSTSPTTTTGVGSSSGASRPAAGPKRTTRRAARRASAHASSSSRCSSGDAWTGRPALVSSPPATSTTERSGRSRSAAAVLAGVAAIPSSTSSTPSRRPDDERAQVGEAEPLETGRDRACGGRRGDGGEQRLPARPVEARRKRQRPLLPTDLARRSTRPGGTRLRRPRPSRRTRAAVPATAAAIAAAALVVLVRDHDVAGRLPARDRLLRRAVALERAVQLQVVGPEARDRGDRRAVGREAEVRARQLQDDHAGGRRRQQLGRRPEVPGTSGRARVHLDAGRAKELDEEERRRRLAGRARDADRRHPRTLEHEVAEAADTGARRAEPGDARRHLRRPDVEERLVVLTRLAVEVGVLADVDVEGAERERLGRRRAGAGERDRASFARRAAARARPRRRRTPRRGSSPAGRQRRPGRRRSPAPADFRGLCTCTVRPVNGRRRPGSQRVCGNPRSTLLVDGSGQRDVTTFPRV